MQSYLIIFILVIRCLCFTLNIQILNCIDHELLKARDKIHFYWILSFIRLITPEENSVATREDIGIFQRNNKRRYQFLRHFMRYSNIYIYITIDPMKEASNTPPLEYKSFKSSRGVAMAWIKECILQKQHRANSYDNKDLDLSWYLVTELVLISLHMNLIVDDALLSLSNIVGDNKLAMKVHIS